MELHLKLDLVHKQILWHLVELLLDLDNLSNEIDSANKVFIHDAGTNKVYEIPKDVMKEWVAGSGGGENASDTAVLTKDENGNIIYDGWSDKKGLSDIQGNSTLNDDFSKADERVDILTESGKVDSEINFKEI